MYRRRTLKRIIAAAALCMAAASAASSDIVKLPASADYAWEEPDYGYYDDGYYDDGYYYDDYYDDGGYGEYEEYDPYYDEYSDRLSEISERQAELEKQLAEADETMQTEQERQALILEEINTLNEKANLVNSYLTRMEMELAAERRSVAEMGAEIDEGIARYKLRLRALYLAGDMSYGDVLLGAGDFYDMLMRSELLRRVTDYDARTLDSLVEKKASYDKKLLKMQQQQVTYDEQALALELERMKLAEFYDSSAETKLMLKEQMEKLADDERKFENEIYAFEGVLTDLLKGSYTGPEDEAFRIDTEKQANAMLDQLYASISSRVASGQKLPDTECRYNFKWPVKNHLEVSSGVGARWGTYHKGIDIPGEGGFPITAAEAGEVVRTNNSCIHNYGKDGSCGCGGGYGNFVIIDHGNGFLTLYAHMTKTSVEIGDKVTREQQIGLMGSTGWSTGTHLHFELRYGGYITNPANFVTY